MARVVTVRVTASCWVIGRRQTEQADQDVWGRDIAQGPVTATLVFSPADPWVVGLELPANGDRVVWEFSRDALTAARHDVPSAGPVGDVEVHRAGDELRIGLTTPTGRAVLWLDLVAVDQLLNTAYELVPAGTEAAQIDWTRELATLLAPNGGE